MKLQAIVVLLWFIKFAAPVVILQTRLVPYFTTVAYYRTVEYNVTHTVTNSAKPTRSKEVVEPLVEADDEEQKPTLRGRLLFNQTFPTAEPDIKSSLKTADDFSSINDGFSPKVLASSSRILVLDVASQTVDAENTITATFSREFNDIPFNFSATTTDTSKDLVSVTASPATINLMEEYADQYDENLFEPGIPAKNNRTASNSLIAKNEVLFEPGLDPLLQPIATSASQYLLSEPSDSIAESNQSLELLVVIGEANSGSLIAAVSESSTKVFANYISSENVSQVTVTSETSTVVNETVTDEHGSSPLLLEESSSEEIITQYIEETLTHFVEETITEHFTVETVTEGVEQPVLEPTGLVTSSPISLAQSSLILGPENQTSGELKGLIGSNDPQEGDLLIENIAASTSEILSSRIRMHSSTVASNEITSLVLSLETSESLLGSVTDSTADITKTRVQASMETSSETSLGYVQTKSSFSVELALEAADLLNEFGFLTLLAIASAASEDMLKPTNIDAQASVSSAMQTKESQANDVYTSTNGDEIILCLLIRARRSSTATVALASESNGYVTGEFSSFEQAMMTDNAERMPIETTLRTVMITLSNDIEQTAEKVSHDENAATSNVKSSEPNTSETLAQAPSTITHEDKIPAQSSFKSRPLDYPEKHLQAVSVPTQVIEEVAPPVGTNKGTAFVSDDTESESSYGACGWMNKGPEYVAVGEDIFNQVAKNGGAPDSCGMKIIAHHGSRSVEVTVNDKLSGGSGACDLKLSPAVFSKLADPSEDRINVTWEWGK